MTSNYDAAAAEGQQQYDLDSANTPGAALEKIRTAGSLSISPDLFEKIYLSPQNRVAGDLRKTFGNPTPLALGGFLLCLSPLSCILMGWRGSSGTGSSNVGVFYPFGGVLMITGGVLEWILGNTFPSVVFGTFGAFWIALSMTLQPFYNSYGSFVTDPTKPPASGLTSLGFNASFAFFLLFMGFLCLIYLVCALRTNVVFFLIFLMLVPAFSCLAAAFWYNAKAATATSMSDATDYMDRSSNLLVAGGALTFVVDMLGWYLFGAIMLASLDFPFALPVGDLSSVIKGASTRNMAKEE